MMGWQWHQLDHMQIICTLLQTDNHAKTLSPIFYKPDTLPDARPTVSKKWRFKPKNTTTQTTTTILWPLYRTICV